MNLNKSLLATGLLMASSIAFAATDSTDIEINVTKDAYVNLTGTAVGSTNSFTTDDIDNATVSLGTLGLESNSAGDCEVTISSANSFKLIHESDNTKDLGVYSLGWGSNTFTAGSSAPVTTACTVTASTLDLVSPLITGPVIAGVYSDTVSVTVVTQ